MSRIQSCTSVNRERGRSIFTSFITAGDPTLEITVPALHALVAGGVDMLELGVPFSDPEAEGPSIQRSSERALSNGMTLTRTLECVKDFRIENSTTPVILMGYLNSFLAMGIQNFARAAAAAGVDGVIIVNLPPESAEEFQSILKEHSLDVIFLVAPTTTKERSKLILSRASGFIYFVSLKGITGADHISVNSVKSNVTNLRRMTDLPVLIGFGIKTPETARQAAEYADGIVVGSALVDTMSLSHDQTEIIQNLTSQAAAIRTALDSQP